MKNFAAALLALAVLVPAAQVKQEETQRGTAELVNTAALSIKKSADSNHGHTWIRTGAYNFTQQYALQRELEKQGYTLDISPGRFWVEW